MSITRSTPKVVVIVADDGSTDSLRARYTRLP